MTTMAVMLANATPVLCNRVRAPPSAATALTPMVVECSSRPKKKATAHHIKTRPKKTQAWDIRRKGPTVYPPLPPLPPDWTLVSSDPAAEQQEEGAALDTAAAAS